MKTGTHLSNESPSYNVTVSVCKNDFMKPQNALEVKHSQWQINFSNIVSDSCNNIRYNHHIFVGFFLNTTGIFIDKDLRECRNETKEINQNTKKKKTKNKNLKPKIQKPKNRNKTTRKKDLSCFVWYFWKHLLVWVFIIVPCWSHSVVLFLFYTLFSVFFIIIFFLR